MDKSRRTASVGSSTPRPIRTPKVEAPSHIVQFFEDENFLATAVGDFLRSGFAAGQPAVVIAAPERVAAFRQRLEFLRLDPARLVASGLLTFLHARETLDAFMVDGMPDATRFANVIGPVITDAAAGRRSIVRCYGEMVDILWKEGNTEAAVRLEELWNRLSETHAFSLLCAYDMGSFYKESHTEVIQRICDCHGTVIPAESFIAASEQDRFREVALLQQRAQSLEHEIEHRRELEVKLRDALAESAQLLEREKVARRETETASAAKSEFLAAMNHELRTPLNAIAGHVQLVQMGLHGPVTAGQVEALRRVERSQRHLLSLINDVLNLVRVGSGKLDYDTTIVPLRAIITQVTTLIEPLLAAKSLHIETSADHSEDPLTARADADKVHQIVLNLLTNAIKYTEEGGHIRVAATLCADDETSVCVSVSDDGVGIPADKLEKIFEPFVQLGMRPLSGQEGLGLGLAISRDLATGMGGDLSATSSVGKGTTFSLRLPRA